MNKEEEILNKKLNNFLNDFLDLAAYTQNRERTKELDEFNLKYHLKELMSKNEVISENKIYPAFFKE
jgi:hypothetical protein